MTVKQIIKISGLKMRDFAEFYGIPYRTLQNWVYFEEGDHVKGRKIAPYVKDLLEFRVKKDLSF